MAYDWPGNVRQLQNFIEHGVIVSEGPVFRTASQSTPDPEEIACPRTAKTLEDATRDHVLQTLEETKWVVGGRHGAAARLGIARTTLVSKMRRLGIESAADEGRGKGGNRHAAFASA